MGKEEVCQTGWALGVGALCTQNPRRMWAARRCVPAACDPPEEAWQEGGCGGWGEEAGEPLHLLGLPDVVAFGDIGRRAQEGGEGSACECTDLYVTPDEMSSGSSHFY